VVFHDPALHVACLDDTFNKLSVTLEFKKAGKWDAVALRCSRAVGGEVWHHKVVGTGAIVTAFGFLLLMDTLPVDLSRYPRPVLGLDQLLDKLIHVDFRELHGKLFSNQLDVLECEVLGVVVELTEEIDEFVVGQVGSHAVLPLLALNQLILHKLVITIESLHNLLKNQFNVGEGGGILGLIERLKQLLDFRGCNHLLLLGVNAIEDRLPRLVCHGDAV